MLGAFLTPMAHRIVLISGGTGVGTSAFSFELSKLLNIPTVVGTDTVREVLRSVLSTDLVPSLGQSTYLVGQTSHYKDKSEEVKRAEIIRGFKMQSSSVLAGIEGVVRRSLLENTPLIVEGVHLIPGKLRISPVYNQHPNRFFECLIYIDDPHVHQARFSARQEIAPDRSTEKYLGNFREIRWIHDYLIGKARASNIPLAENSGALGDGVALLLKEYYS